MVIIYTDGACSGNPGPGGWGVLLEYNGRRKMLSGREDNTTNNRMELKAAIEGIKAIKRTSDIKLYTDSNYVKNGITTWIDGWKAKNWRLASGKPVKNVDLWQELDGLVGDHNIEWCWVKGHSGIEGNEIADKLATDAIKSS